MSRTALEETGPLGCSIKSGALALHACDRRRVCYRGAVSFVAEFDRLDIKGLVEKTDRLTGADVENSLASGTEGLAAFAALTAPAASSQLEQLCRRSQDLTQRRFGKIIRLFAPLYLSNECVNICRYCGFSRNNDIRRVTLSVAEVESEARALTEQGFRNVLLVAGEHPKFVSNGYLENCLLALRPSIPGLSLEVGPMATDAYRTMVAAGAEGLVVYQETYDRERYRLLHPAGPKKHYDWRLETAERAYAAGFRRLGIGALFGLTDWREEALALAAHAEYLLRHCWRSQLTVAFPRIRPCAGNYQPSHPLDDRALVQLLAAFRIAFPDVGLVLSTREPARLRDGLIPLGVTLMSAGSHTEPGGYTGAGGEQFSRPPESKPRSPAAREARETAATGQFEIADDRRPQAIAELIRRLGYEPVWKDWDAALCA